LAETISLEQAWATESVQFMRKLIMD